MKNESNIYYFHLLSGTNNISFPKINLFYNMSKFFLENFLKRGF